MMGGGRGGGRNQGQNQPDPATRLAIAVDAPTNTLVIAAADPLFEEVRLLVHQLDTANAEENETMRVVTLHRTSADSRGESPGGFCG